MEESIWCTWNLTETETFSFNRACMRTLASDRFHFYSNQARVQCNTILPARTHIRYIVANVDLFCTENFLFIWGIAISQLKWLANLTFQFSHFHQSPCQFAATIKFHFENFTQLDFRSSQRPHHILSVYLFSCHAIKYILCKIHSKFNWDLIESKLSNQLRYSSHKWFANTVHIFGRRGWIK